MLDGFSGIWHWSVSGILIGLIVPILLLIGNKSFGVSSSFRHMCAAALPLNISFFKYDWKSYRWNLFFVAGIFMGAWITMHFFHTPDPATIAIDTKESLGQLGIRNFTGFLPAEIFDWSNVMSLRTLVFVVVGGFLVGFGTRWAGGCTSGHSIMGISNLQWPSLVATICFMIGGFAMTHLLLPYILNL